jgi:hypothetical protein
MKQNDSKNPITRATMRGVPGDAARRRGLKRILFPLMMCALAIGFGMGGICGGMGLCPWWLGLIFLVAGFMSLLHFQSHGTHVVYGFFKGARGEEMSASSLARLPIEWTVFNGVIMPTGEDIDHVVVGPQGVFVIETKHWSGEVDLVNGEILANGRSLTINKSPIAQVRRSTKAIEAVIQLPATSIQGVLCFAGKQFLGQTKYADEIAVCSHLNLEQLILNSQIRLDATEIARILARLNNLNIVEGL